MKNVPLQHSRCSVAFVYVLAWLCTTSQARAAADVNWAGADIGNPLLPGSATTNGDGTLSLRGGGSDIWGTSDQFYFYNTAVTGSVWSVAVRVQDVQGADWWTRCELMVRRDNGSGVPREDDPFISLVTTRQNGANVIQSYYRPRRSASCESDGFSPGAPPYPNAWFRVLRNGSVFSGWHGTDGTNWTKFWETDTATNAYGFDGEAWPGQLLVGVAVTAHNDSDPLGAVAVVSDLSLDFPSTTPPPLDLSRLASAENGDVAPLGGFDGTNWTEIADQSAKLHYLGPDGTMDFNWTKPQSGSGPLFGDLRLATKMTGGAPVSVPLARGANLTWVAPATWQASSFESANQGIVLSQTFEIGGSNVTLRTTGEVLGKNLVLSVTCDAPVVQAADCGLWEPNSARRSVIAPYYSGAVWYYPAENLFVNAFLDWTASAASEEDRYDAVPILEETRTRYASLTDGTRNCLQERVIFSVAWHAAEVFPNIPNPPSPYRSELGQRMILEGGSYEGLTDRLNDLASYGVTNCFLELIAWTTNWAYNPWILPATPYGGGDIGLSNAVALATRLGMRAGVSENYADYYPAYPFFNEDDIALDSQGNRVLAWRDLGVQSFAIKPNAILQLAKVQVPEIHRRYGTTGTYVDVFSCVFPWFHVDQRAGEVGAGKYTRAAEAYRELWAYEREAHGGPVWGEGCRHWMWSGCLDAVPAGTGMGWTWQKGLSMPLHVDFDLLKIHPLQLNSGMGLYSTWCSWPPTNGSSWETPDYGGIRYSIPSAVLDQYRAQEIAYGHGSYIHDLVPNPGAWLEDHLVTPVTARYATAKPADIAYLQGGVWLDPTAAAKSQVNRECVRVTYDNGLSVTVNCSSNTVAANGWLLPTFGWLAEGAGVTAGTVLRTGAFTDFADAGDSLFVNARSLDWDLSGFRRIRPTVGQFQQTARRTFRVTYNWEVNDPLRKPYAVFVQFCSNNVVKLTQDHSLAKPAAQWPAGQTQADGPYTITLPSNLADGDYDWLTGLLAPPYGTRLFMFGHSDTEARIRLGTLRVASQGSILTFIPDTTLDCYDPSRVFRQDLNETSPVVDFGDVRTDGSVRLTREGDQWALATWPRDWNFTLELNAARFGAPSVVSSLSATNTNSPAVVWVDDTHFRVPLSGAVQYRWSANTALSVSPLTPTSLTTNRWTTASFRTTVSGLPPLSYQWQKGSGEIFTNLPYAGSVTGVVNLTLRNLNGSDSGDYRVVVTNAAGSVTSTVATLAVRVPPSILTPPQNLSVTLGSNLTFMVVAAGTDPLSYQWQHEGTNLAGATTTVFSKDNAELADAGSYRVVVTNLFGAIPSATAILAVNVPPSITTPPLDQTVILGGDVSLSVAVEGTAPLSYQWQHNWAIVAGATTSALNLPKVQLADAGTYQVVVTNIAGSVTSAGAVLTVNVPPSIITPPQSQTVILGSNVVFDVEAAGTAPLSYQWQHDGVNLAGATSSVLSIENVQLADAGAYQVRVINIAGSTVSAPALLTVNVPPSITIPPQSQAVKLGSNATFTVVASGTAPLCYQWLFEGTNLVGATTSVFTRENVQTTDTGNYAVVITNMVGSVTSAPVSLRVQEVAAQPRIRSIEWTGTSILIHATSEIGLNYTLEMKEDLGATWTPLSLRVPGTGEDITFRDEQATATTRFYRVRVE